MIFWSPATSKIEYWQPTTGWNAAFSEQEKIQCTNLFFFFKTKKGLSERKAEVLAQMVIYKQKNNGMKYSEEQEAQLKEYLTPIFNH
jgi:hypothetical protein